jgi:hypothetical protein
MFHNRINMKDGIHTAEFRIIHHHKVKMSSNFLYLLIFKAQTKK